MARWVDAPASSLRSWLLSEAPDGTMSRWGIGRGADPIEGRATLLPTSDSLLLARDRGDWLAYAEALEALLGAESDPNQPRQTR